jgi:protein ImuB
MSSSNGAYSPLWICLYFDQLALDIFCRDKQSDSSDFRPLVITEKHKVYRCNYAAADLGIQIGQSMDTAFTLSDRVTSIERQPDREAAALQHLAQWAYQFTPNVALKSDHCLLLEVSASLKLFKGLDNLKQQIYQGLREQNYQVILGIAETPLAANLLARAGILSETTTINDITVGHLQTTDAIIRGLEQMGLATLGDVLALPVSSVKRRFGTFFGDYLLRLTGEKPDPQKYISEQAKFHHSITFMHDVNNLSSLAFPINRLLGELSEFLTQRQFWISQLTWHLCHRAHPERRSFSVHLAVPANSVKMFLALTQLKLDQINDVKEVDHIALSVSRFFPAGQDSADLFAGRGFNHQTVNASNTEEQNYLLNMLRAKLGKQACFGLSESNDHRPEKAWTRVLPNEQEKSREPFDTTRAVRPSFLLPTPKALNVIDDAPYLSGKLTLVKGPERIDFGWWDQPLDKPLTRDYYIARQKQGGLVWIFKYLAAERWYLHGIFS